MKNSVLENYKGIIEKIKPISQQLEQLEEERETLRKLNGKRLADNFYSKGSEFEPSKEYHDTDFEIAIVEAKIILAIKEVKEIIEEVK